MWPRIVESPASAYFRLLVVKCQHSIDSERGIALQIYCSFSLRVLRLRPPASALRAVPQFQPPAIGNPSAMWHNDSGKGRKDLVARKSRGIVSGTLSGERWIDFGMAVVSGVLVATTVPAAV